MGTTEELPGNRLRHRFRDARSTNCPSDSGMLPAMALSLRSSAVRAARLMIPEGMAPARLLFDKVRETTRPVEPQRTPNHWQTATVLDNQLSFLVQASPPREVYTAARARRS